ncbi:MAG TPA: periplasmic heavy metal sensor [Thermoanaerobaculia bacterium]|nr:periplasmic heavy metal sensor [Thermoanaerobaculia bacterium]
MNRRTAVAIALGTALILGATSAAAELPPGKWWRNPQIAERLGLAPEQQARLDAVFREAANELIDRRAEVEKLNLALRGELDQPQINRQSLQRVAAQLSAARGRLFEREVIMLADMRAVLDGGQWSRLRTHLDRRRQGPPPRRR